ncbi:type VII secretion integral membrane protein EccD [Actinophytocola sp.]|uniref:type VII secretion integral membrane protein EccD n=1 Tax=Actinophytocola sp. TaxID=1872138 RepID=UPI002D7FD6F8|nr:type VII secretion integral membrane protein EccD [Actinophytocola sp.]HET9140825.1 type VII secretion integral membrane protein EccD [Actinophytocola sp.]
MTSAVAPAPCRVTVVAPQARMDVALPLACTLAELVPQLVRLAGGPVQPGGDSVGWSLSRIGQGPLAPGLTVAAAIRDGEVLHLGPRARLETPALFDDVVDAIASAAQTRRGAWRPRVGRRLGVAVAAALFTGTALLTLAALRGSPAAAAGAGLLAVALLLAGAALSRALGDAAAGAACAGAGAFAATLAGLTALPPHALWPPAADSVGIGLGAVTLYCAVAAVLVPRAVAWFASAAVAAALGALITAVALLFGVPPVSVAAVSVALVTAITAAAPTISLRLARLPLPHVPADIESFRENDQPALGSDVVDQTALAAEVLTGLVVAAGVVAAGCCVVVLSAGTFTSALLAGLVGVAWILRSRGYAGAVQRVSLVVLGLAVLAILGVHLAATAPAASLGLAAAALAVAGGASLYYAGRVTRGLHSPFRARWLDVLEYAVLIALLPVAGAIIGVYEAVRDAVS